MPLQDVSDDQTMISWLRQAGHAHLLDEQLRNANRGSSPPLPTQNNPYGPTSSSHFSPIPPSNYPPPTASHSSPPPMFGGGFNSTDPVMNTIHRSGSFSPTNFPPNAIYGSSGGPMSPTHHFSGPSFDHQSSSPFFHSSPTHFLGPNINQQQLDMDIEVKLFVTMRSKYLYFHLKLEYET